MSLWIVSSTLLVLVAARPKSGQGDEATSTDCPESRLSYFMTTRVEPLASATYKADDVDESTCREWCSKNQSPSQTSANCTSYSYNDETRRCKLYAEHTYPDGALERRVTSKPKRLFEKYCISEKMSKECGNRNYLRVDEMLLSGFAQSTAIFKTLAECMNHCVEEKEFKCKSAMYFYEEGECITNLDTISSNNTLIHVEDDDRVVFIQNDCLIKEPEPEQKPKKENLKADAKIEKVVQTSVQQKITTEATTTVQETTTESMTTVQQETTTEAKIVQQEATTEATTTVQQETTFLPTTIKTTKLIEMIHNEDKTDTVEVKPSEMPLAERPINDEKITKNVEIGFMSSAEEHPQEKQQLYGAKILEPETQAALNERTESVLERQDFSLPKPSKQAVPDESKVPKTNNALNEFKLNAPPSGEPELVSKENRYFTAWSTWSPCSNVGERRIRRRKCTDFKKCKGSLMQIEYCPPELVIQEESVEEQQPEKDAFGPIGPSRQPLPVAKNQAEDGSGSAPSILPPQLPKQEVEPLPEGAPAPSNVDDVWSPWLGVCQHFVSTQPCKAGQIIGFESRECIAKDPKQCQGPFFRYCTLPC